MIDWTIVGWIVTAAIALAAIIVAVVATRRWGNRRASVEWFVDTTPLLAAGADTTLLEVTYRDIPVKNPVLVSFGIVNTGPRDITTEMFDANRPIEVRLAGTLYGITGSTGNLDLVQPAVGSPADDAVIELRPRLLKRQEAWAFSAVVSGVGNVEVDSPLIDTDLKHLVIAAQSSGRDRGVLGEIAFTFTGVFGEMAALLIGRRR